MGIYEPIETGSRSQRTFSFAARALGALKLDGPLLVGLSLITLYGFVILYSASGQSWNRVADAAIRAALGGFAMCALAQVKPAFLRRLALPLWVMGVVLLVVVDITGHIGKGAQRWLDLGFIRFQPSEIMKLAVPMTCAWWLHERALPPSFSSLSVLALVILVPTGLTILQPDLGTGGLILIDNVFQGGRVLDESSTDESVVAIHNLNEAIVKDERVRVVMLAIGDGVSVVQKI